MSCRVIAIGEVLWDLLPSGPQMGGAPTNFACHVQSLGEAAGVITRVGDDELGREAVARLRGLGICTAGVQTDPAAPTGTVSVSLLGDGQPCYTIQENVAWDRIQVEPSALEMVRRADVICLGSLAQRAERSCASIRQLVGAAPAEAFRIFDVNFRQRYYTFEVVEGSLLLANALKLNDEELPVLAKLFGWSGSERELLGRLIDKFALSLLALTRGARGSVLYADGRWSERAGFSAVVEDTVGAGDSFTAALAVGWLRKMDLDELNAAANRVACHVCSCRGATPRLPDELRNLFEP